MEATAGIVQKANIQITSRFNEETKRDDKSHFESREMQEKLNAIQREEVSGYGESKSKE